ncbi:MAG: RHS repeat domain-containing protein [Mesonia hippocampi]|uniref:RHS repeat domain-containing protein n=1 Tax=Mesonia hippocampi TaxID=1628250 RepID=UPI003F9CFC0D
MDNLSYKYYPNSNRLQRVDDGVTLNTMVNDIKDQSGNNYTYNDLGQLVSNAQDKISYTYNTAGLVTTIHNTLTGNPVVKFVYDDKGKRLKKEGYINGQLSYTDYYVRDVSGSPMAIYRNSTLKENPIYGANRLGIHYREDNSDVYQLIDHLGNVRAVVTEQAGNPVALVAKTDYYPGGMAMPNRNIVGDYRYGYQGEYAETDKETGMPAFELRLYDPRINRWISPDPAGQYHSPYMAMGNNWISRVDPDGGTDGCEGCPDNPIELDAVVITAPGRNFDYSGMPLWMQNTSLDTGTWHGWEGGSMADYNKKFGMDFGSQNPGSTWYQWYYRTQYKPEFDAFISDMHSAQLKVGLATLAVGFAPYALSVGSASLVGVKATSSIVAQSVITKQVNFIGVIGDTFFMSGYGDFLGSSFEAGYSFQNNGWYTSTILDTKPVNTALKQGLISTAFSVKLHGMDKLVGQGNNLAKGLYTTSYQFGNYAAQK